MVVREWEDPGDKSPGASRCTSRATLPPVLHEHLHTRPQLSKNCMIDVHWTRPL